jgi:hypothetical protein
MLKKAAFPAFCLSFLLFLAPFALADFTTPSKNISNSALDSLYPKIAHVPGTSKVFAVWIETDGMEDFLCFSKSTDGAQTWSTPTAITTWGQILVREDELNDYYSFSFVVRDPHIHVVIRHREDIFDDFNLWYIRSTDLGDSWDYANQKWLTNNDYETMCPDIDARGEYVHIAYHDGWPGNADIMYKRIANYGAGSIDQTRRLSFSSTPSLYARIAVSQDGQTVNIVYQDPAGSGVYNIFHKVIRDSGAGTYDTHRLTFGTNPTTEWNGHPDIAAATGSSTEYFYVVYQAFWPGNREVMYKRIDNWGLSPFNVYTARLTYSSTESRSKSSAITEAPASSQNG